MREECSWALGALGLGSGSVYPLALAWGMAHLAELVLMGQRQGLEPWLAQLGLCPLSRSDLAGTHPQLHVNPPAELG